MHLHLFHMILFFGNRLLQRGSLMGCRSCQEPASEWALERLQLSSGHGVFCGLQCGYTPHHGPPWATEEQRAPLWSSPQAAGQSLLEWVKYLPLLLILPPWFLRGCFSLFSSLFSLFSSLLFFLSFLTQKMITFLQASVSSPELPAYLRMLMLW